MGRPTKKDETTVTLLEKGLAYGFSVTEACDYAKLSRNTYYRWIEEDEAFRDRMSRAQTDLVRKSKINLASGINSGDIELSKYYLERKCKDEFSTKQSVDLGGKVGVEIKLPEEANEYAE